MKKYKLVCKKGEGTFSEVVKAENLETGKEYAIKCMKQSFDSFDQVNNLREIQALKRLTPHPHIVDLEEVLYDGPSGRLAIVFELMDANLYDLISGRREHLDKELVRRLGYQMFVAIHHMHDNGVFHRDIKPENILVDPTGQHLKLADFGSCRSIKSRGPLTEYIATRWYRSPECLLTDGHYGPEMDVFGAGCVLFELIALFPLFPGADEIDQVNRIHKVLGTPPKSIVSKLKAKGSSKINYSFPYQKGIGIKHYLPHGSQDCIDLIDQTLVYDYEKRIPAVGCIEHDYFSTLHVKEKTKKNLAQTHPSSPKLLAKSKSPPENTERSKKLIKRNTSVAETSNVKSTRLVKDRAHPSVKKNVSDDSRRKSNPKKKDEKVNNLKSIKTNLQQNKARRKEKESKPNEKKDVSKVTAKSRLFGRNPVPGKRTNAVANTTSRRPNPRLQKFEKKSSSDKGSSDRASDKSQDKSTNSKRRNKYSNVTSSGYGKSYSSNAKSKPLKQKTTTTSGTKPIVRRNRLRQREREREHGTSKVSGNHDSAGTGNTGVSTLSAIPTKNRLPKNRVSLSKRNQPERSKRNVSTRLPIVINE
uniref:Protein kinase domain-containing protein n=1 Tax=Chaetoceros debilis TaxID=122233 RepID=A0A7S3Q2L4_9STRA|eukprot:CAMPEP_0194074504 /NCGR_PEP_ID=MMETSP0149-20130528/1623_1 /TAXON_ID=122233 /ORGANISM="Chaetoceros debilis, Strain MM31A-1" /LENGTH=586 /DNA_ID=CAMNT_0038754711 /DNA_START=332 /DNA_END=2092 /DNA_ORIENTATION=+